MRNCLISISQVNQNMGMIPLQRKWHDFEICLYILNLNFLFLYPIQNLQYLLILHPLSLSSMILSQLNKNQAHYTLMANHRNIYNKIKALVVQHKFDSIDTKEVNDQKQLVIQHLNSDDEQMYDQFEQLTFYQQRYLALSKFLVNKKKEKGVIDLKETEKLVELFQENYEPDVESKQPNMQKKVFKPVDSFEIDERNEKYYAPNSRLVNAGLGQAVFEFFDKRQRESKNIGFKDLIEKNVSVTNRTSSFRKKPHKPGHDIEIRKLLQENKRLHNQLQKRAKQDIELNEFEKNVLRQQKQRCMKRIQQLQEQVQQLAKNNYKLQEIEKSRKAVSTFVNDSMQTSKNQILPYYIPTRHNDLNLITEKNKIAKMSNIDKDNALINLVEGIPPIQKKQEHSFDEEFHKYNNNPHNNILADLLQEKEDQPKRQLFSGPTQVKPPQRNIYFGGEEVKYSKPPMVARPNDSIQNGNRFDSFSLAQTAYNNSSLFLNASKNLIAIDSQTSTRNKVAFFKNSLVIAKDQEFEIAYKRSNLDHSYSKVRLIFYINNKTDTNQSVNIEYDYEVMYYNFNVTQKLRYVPPGEQSREVVEINLVPSCPDLNSVVDVHISIGQKKYDLWVPVCFIDWTNQTLIEKDEVGFMTVQPDRQFASYEHAAKLLPLSRKIIPTSDQTQAYLYGRSRFGNHEIKFTWWQKELTIDSSIKILDFLGFVMHHFK